MPRFTGQNKKKRNPRYFLNEGMQQMPKLGDEVKLSDGRMGEVIDVVGQNYEVAINAAEGGYGMFDGSVTVSIHDIESVGPNYPGHGDLPGRVSEEDKDPYRNVPLDARPKTPEERDKALEKQGYRHGLYGRKKNRYYDPEVQAIYLAAYERGVEDSKPGGVFGP